jgi:uncharacterized protein (DUF779 family)
MAPPRVIATPSAEELIRRLVDEFGPLIFHQSGGCCEGTAPMCFRQSDFRVGQSDVFLGTIGGCPFYIGAPTFQYFASSQLILDVTTGGGDSFSLEAPEGVRFITRSRLFTNEELRELEAAGPPPAGPQTIREFPSRGPQS